MKLAYLTNQYPAISHSFIRLEITALEEQGVEIARFSVRRSAGPLPDPADQRELARTESLLERGAGTLMRNLLNAASTRPRAFRRALRLAMKMGWRSERGMMRHFAYLAEACVLQSRCASRGITHLHVHHATNPAAVALLCRALGGPAYSLTVHGPEEFEHAARLALGLKIAHAAFVVSVSAHGHAELSRWCDDGDQEKIHIVHCGVDGSFLSDAVTCVPDVPRLIWVGRLAEQKDPRTLVHAVGWLRAHQVACSVTMLGDGPMRPTIANEIARYNLGDIVTLAGWANHATVMQELLQARALVLSSRAENIPIVIMEALALGRPVVSTNVGGIGELVEDGKSGWLVPAGSVDALGQAMHRVLCSSVERLSEMGQVGRARVVESFSLPRQARQLRALFALYSASGRGMD